jgi:hypothetical protein
MQAGLHSTRFWDSLPRTCASHQSHQSQFPSSERNENLQKKVNLFAVILHQSAKKSKANFWSKKVDILKLLFVILDS